MNQLIYVRDYENAKIYTYTYDTAGNLIAENISNIDSNGAAYNTVHKSYQYNDTNWGDKLTSYDGQTITYDAIGNPLSYRDGMTMTWKNGRQLATLQDSDDTISYEYDSSSIRTSKTVDGVKHTYAYLSGKLIYETRGNAKFYYSYDANGILYSVKYTLTDDSDMLTYFFTHNSRGDIVGIYDSNGVQQVKYEYDAWGDILSVTNSQGILITDQNHIANLNPFRYRGYYYDSETGLYYLMSRYYDPVTHRFINADGYFQSGNDILDTNMSAYCRNNPVMYSDPYGETVYTIGVGAFACAGLDAYISIYYACDDKGNSGLYWSTIDYNESLGLGLLGASAGITSSVNWDADTIDDLFKSYINVGGSFGEGVSIGLDLSCLDKDTLTGISVTAGVGAGIDWVHMYSTTTYEIWASNSNNTYGGGGQSFSTPVKKQPAKPEKKSTYKICTGCGRPKGNQYTWQCKSPSYF